MGVIMVLAFFFIIIKRGGGEREKERWEIFHGGRNFSIIDLY